MKKTQVTGVHSWRSIVLIAVLQAVLIASSTLLTSCADSSKTSESATPDPQSEAAPKADAPAEPPPFPGSLDNAPNNTLSASSKLPASIETSVFQDIANNNGVPVETLQLVGARTESWPDGCLGLGSPDEFCTFAIVEGWEVTVSQGNNLWVYRTNSNGSVMRSVDVPETESF